MVWSVVVSACAPFWAVGEAVYVPDVPPPAFADLERMTNAPIQGALIGRARVFEGRVSLFATPSNSVEVAFGSARNGDGILLPGDETFSFGWKGGVWFLASSTNCVSSQALETPSLRTIAFTLRISEGGTPVSVALSATDADAPFLSPFNTSSPAWPFSRTWDTVRLTIRGPDDPEETVSIRFDNDPVLFLMR